MLKFSNLHGSLSTAKCFSYISPLEENFDSNAIMQKLLEQCQEVQGNIASGKECETSTTEDEELTSEIELENE